MSHRMKITLSDSTLTELRAAATDRGEPMARVATRLISDGLSAGKREPEPPAPERVVETWGQDRGSDRRALWLEPWDGEREWRQDMWADIVALHRRYPRELAYLKDEWWDHTAHVETLCALVVWRRWIDRTAEDPREELFFHAQLEDYGRALRQEGGGVSAAWLPDAPPTSWA
jgi:hypothetical protein